MILSPPSVRSSPLDDPTRNAHMCCTTRPDSGSKMCRVPPAAASRGRQGSSGSTALKRQRVWAVKEAEG